MPPGQGHPFAFPNASHATCACYARQSARRARWIRLPRSARYAWARRKLILTPASPSRESSAELASISARYRRRLRKIRTCARRSRTAAWAAAFAKGSAQPQRSPSASSHEAIAHDAPAARHQVDALAPLGTDCHRPVLYCLAPGKRPRVRRHERNACGPEDRTDRPDRTGRGRVGDNCRSARHSRSSGWHCARPVAGPCIGSGLLFLDLSMGTVVGMHR